MAGRQMTVTSGSRLTAKPRVTRSADTLFRFAAAGCASVVLILLAGMLVRTTWSATPPFRPAGIGFVTQNDWYPTAGHFRALSLIFGTFLTSVTALLFALPLSLLLSPLLSQSPPPPLLPAL